MSPSNRKKEGKQVHLCINTKMENISHLESLQNLSVKFDVRFTDLVWWILKQYLSNPTPPTNLPTQKLKREAKVTKLKQQLANLEKKSQLASMRFHSHSHHLETHTRSPFWILSKVSKCRLHSRSTSLLISLEQCSLFLTLAFSRAV